MALHHQKIAMTRRGFRIGELARTLKVKKFVIRFWEKEFELGSSRTEGRQRYYTHDDVQLFTHIKDLLYQQGYTIAGAKARLMSLRQPSPSKSTAPGTPHDLFLQRLALVKKDLQALYQRLART